MNICRRTFDANTPTIFLDFDGTLHVGHAMIDQAGKIHPSSDRPLFEFAPLLVDLLRPYPEVQIVLTTSWLERVSREQVIQYLPEGLRQRVVDTTEHVKPTFGSFINGTSRTYVIASYALGKKLRRWIAIDDSVFGPYEFTKTPGELETNFVLLDTSIGINERRVLDRLKEWLAVPQPQ